MNNYLTGLESVLNEGSLKETHSSNFKFISIDDIKYNSFNKYRQTEENIQIIKKSIEEAGLLNALVVVKDNDDKYLLISGHGRLAAIKRLKEYNFQGTVHNNDEVPCFIDKTNRTTLENNLNVLRANAQKEESIDNKVDNVKKAEEIYLEYRKQGLITVSDETNKRKWISAITGYSESSIKLYLQKIHKKQTQSSSKTLTNEKAIDKIIKLLHNISDILNDVQNEKEVMNNQEIKYLLFELHRKYEK